MLATPFRSSSLDMLAFLPKERTLQRHHPSSPFRMVCKLPALTCVKAEN